MKKNEGEVPQYYVENSHPAIVTPEEWKAVQDELERRKLLGRKYSGTSIFATRLVCADCGEFFGAKTWHSNSKYRKTVWRCTHKYIGEDRCGTPNLDEETIKERFMDAVNAIIQDKDAILDDCRIMREIASDCTEIDAELTALLQEIEVITELTRRCIEENSRTAQDQNAFETRYNGFVERYEKATARVTELQSQRHQKELAADNIGDFMFDISELNQPIQQFDEGLWLALVDRVLVHSDGRMVFQFIGGFEITA